MTHQEAKEILSACRPSGADDADPLVAEALQIARGDAELSAWLEKERTIDRIFSAKLGSFPVPETLPEKILGEPKIIRVPFLKKPSVWAAMAAALVLMAGLSWLAVPSKNPSLVTFDEYRRQVSGIVRNFWMLKHHSSDVNELQEWLAKSDSPSDFSVPPKLDAMTALGCRSFEVEGNKVSLICFKLRDGKTEAHLFVVDRKMIENAPPENTPTYAQRSGWSMAFWSDAKNVYILASPTDPSALKELLL